MTTHDPFALWELSTLLHGYKPPKVFCAAEVRGDDGYRIAECTHHRGHPMPHTDTHTGMQWAD